VGLLQPESLLWADQIENLKGKTRKEWRAELKKAHDLSSSQITYLLAIKACFDQAAIDKIRQASFTLSLNGALALAGLKGKVSDLPGAVHSALDVILAQRLATKQIKALVAWIISGQPASAFDPHAKPPKTAGSPPPSAHVALGQPRHVARLEASQQVLDIDHDKLAELNEKARIEKARGDGQTKHQKALADYLQTIIARPSLGTSNAAPSANTADPGIAATIFLDWLADIPFIARIKAKVKKGKPLTGGEKSLLWLHKAGELTGRGLKALLKLIKPLFKIVHWILKILVDTLKEVGLYKYVKAVFIFGVFILALWFAWEAFNYGFMRPVEMIWSKVHVRHAAEESNTNGENQPVQEPAAVGSSALGSSRLKTSNSSLRTSNPTSTPVAPYQPAVSFQPAVYDQKLLEQEIAAVPPQSLIKAFPLAPDETMPGDLAAGRLQDLTDTDKYTMKLGGSTQKITSVSPTSTNFTLNYKSADALGGFLSGSGQMNFFWEDVAAIHTDEVDSLLPASPGAQPAVFYQCSLIVSGSKDALAIQCATADDLKHLVSTMEYFIRHSRLGHDTALGGMPYTCQGARFKGPRVAETLWAGSPMDKAGLKCGDYVWSVDGNPYLPPRWADLQAALRSLTPGRHDLYVVSDSDWNKAFAANNADRSKPFNPLRRKTALVVP